jgi:hypothetical protein
LETASCDHYGELRGKTVFGCKDDGSIDGKEFVSPILSSDAGLEAIDTFCDLAARHEFAVDKKCGFHAHFDLGEESIDALRRIARAYLKTQNLWLRFASESRRENHYCQHIDWDSETIDRQETTGDFYNFAQNLDRYQWCNFAAYAEHSTVEIRLHTSTLDEDKISNWVKAHARFIDWAVSATDEEIDGLPSNLSAQFDMLCEIWADESLAVFYRRRAKKFGTTLETLAVA